MQTTYILRKDKTNKDGTMPIRAVITFQGARIRKNIKSVKTKEKHWKNQRIKPNTKSEAYNNHIEYNQILDEFQEKVNAIFRFIHLRNIKPSEDFILNKLGDKHFGQNSLAPKFFACFDEFIETSKSTKALGTIKKYVTVRNFLKDFQDSTGFSVRFDTIDIDFYEKFRDYSFLKTKYPEQLLREAHCYYKNFYELVPREGIS